MTAVKICGITRREDAEAAAYFGATYVGFVLWAKSPRAASLAVVQETVALLPSSVTPVGVFVDPTAQQINEAAAAGIRIAQVHSASNAVIEGITIPVIRAVHLAGHGIEPEVADEMVLLDAHDPVKHGGTGQTIDWKRAQAIAQTRRVILAGGLTPFNVRQAIEHVRPFAVDVASGVESRPGIKDQNLIRAFITAAQQPSGTKGTHGT
jgi:phosphoribosylanthranilate isomerase